MADSQANQGSADPRSTAKELRDNLTGGENKDWLQYNDGKKTARKLGMNDATFDKCREVFFNADKDASGSINMSELRELLDHVLPEKLNDDEFERTVQKFDENHDGQLNFDEFLEVLADTKVYQNEHLSEMIDIMSDEVRKQMQFERLTPQEKLKIQGVDKKHVLQYVRSEVAQMNSCLQLPMAIGIFVAFASAILMHEKIEILHAVDKAITWDIHENANFAFGGNVPFENGRMGHKNIQDVNTFADFWSWFNMGLVPLFWRAPSPADWEVNEVRTNILEKCKSQQAILEEFGYSSSSRATASPFLNHTFPGDCPEGQETLNFPHAWFGSPPTQTYKFYFSSVAGMRLRQERTDLQPCPGKEKEKAYEAKLHTGPCVPDPGYWLRPEIRQSFFSDVDRMDRPDGPNVYLLSGWSQTKVRQELRKLENSAWADPYTSKIELLYTLYNAHVDTMSAVYVVFFVNRAGHFYRMIQPVTFWLNPYHGWWNYCIDGVWMLLIAKIAVEEAMEIYVTVKIHGWQKTPGLYLAVSNIIDWMNVFYVLAIAVLWYLHLLRLQKLQETLELVNVTEVGSFLNEETREDYFVQVDLIVQGGEVRRIALALYPIVVVSRFFKAFSAQPRLALVTQTVARASTDLVHFGLVFFSIFGLFTMSAMVLFGQDLSEFANFNRAADSVFHVLLGDFEWEVMKDVGRLPAVLWFWSFMMLVNMVMLNMLLAVIMDVYTEVRGAIGSHAETLWSQASEIWRRRRELKSGKRVSLDYVLSCIDPTTGRNYKHGGEKLDYFNVATFMSAVPGLGEKQAQRILIESLIAQEDELLISQSMAEGMLDIQRIDRRVNHLHGSVQNVIRMCEMSTKLLKQLHERSEKRARTLADGSPDEPGANATSIDYDDQVLGQKVEEKLRESSWEKPPPWFESFAGSVLQRFDRLEARVDSLATELGGQGGRRPGLPPPKALVPESFAKGGKLPNVESADVGFCGVSKAPRHVFGTGICSDMDAGTTVQRT